MRLERSTGDGTTPRSKVTDETRRAMGASRSIAWQAAMAACSLWLAGCDRAVGLESDDAAGRAGDAGTAAFETPSDVDRSCVPGSGGQPGSAWPMLGGGPEHHGRSPFVGPSQPDVKWVTDLPGSIHTRTDLALAADGTLYLAVNKNSATAPGYLLALDAAGEVRWQFDPGGANFSRPVIGRDGTLYVGCRDSATPGMEGRLWAIWNLSP